MAHSARKIALKMRWANLFAISAVTAIAFVSAGFVIYLAMAGENISTI